MTSSTPPTCRARATTPAIARPTATASRRVPRRFPGRVRVRDGATGEARWERSFPGSEESSHSSTSSDQAFAFASTTDVSDQSVVTLPGPDVDGDGLPEVLVSRGDVHREYEEQYEYAPFGAGDSSYRETLIATNVFEVLSGATGEPLASKVVPDVAAVGVLRDAGDLDDDGQPDLLIEHRAQPPFQQVCTGGITVSSCETSGGSSHLEVERLDGRTLVPQWRASAPEGSEAALQGTRADFDGDGVLDLLVSEYRYDRPESAITAVSGDDGAILWRHASTGYLIVEAVAFLDGDGDADVLGGPLPQRLVRPGPAHRDHRAAGRFLGGGAAQHHAGTAALRPGGGVRVRPAVQPRRRRRRRGGRRGGFGRDLPAGGQHPAAIDGAGVRAHRGGDLPARRPGAACPPRATWTATAARTRWGCRSTRPRCRSRSRRCGCGTAPGSGARLATAAAACRRATTTGTAWSTSCGPSPSTASSPSAGS